MKISQYLKFKLLNLLFYFFTTTFCFLFIFYFSKICLSTNSLAKCFNFFQFRLPHLLNFVRYGVDNTRHTVGQEGNCTYQCIMQNKLKNNSKKVKNETCRIKMKKVKQNYLKGIYAKRMLMQKEKDLQALQEMNTFIKKSLSNRISTFPMTGCTNCSFILKPFNASSPLALCSFLNPVTNRNSTSLMENKKKRPIFAYLFSFICHNNLQNNQTNHFKIFLQAKESLKKNQILDTKKKVPINLEANQNVLKSNLLSKHAHHLPMNHKMNSIFFDSLPLSVSKRQEINLVEKEVKENNLDVKEIINASEAFKEFTEKSYSRKKIAPRENANKKVKTTAKRSELNKLKNPRVASARKLVLKHMINHIVEQTVAKVLNEEKKSEEKEHHKVSSHSNYGGRSPYIYEPQSYSQPTIPPNSVSSQSYVVFPSNIASPAYQIPLPVDHATTAGANLQSLSSSSYSQGHQPYANNKNEYNNQAASLSLHEQHGNPQAEMSHSAQTSPIGQFTQLPPNKHVPPYGQHPQESVLQKKLHHPEGLHHLYQYTSHNIPVKDSGGMLYGQATQNHEIQSELSRKKQNKLKRMGISFPDKLYDPRTVLPSVSIIPAVIPFSVNLQTAPYNTLSSSSLPTSLPTSVSTSALTAASTSSSTVAIPLTTSSTVAIPTTSPSTVSSLFPAINFSQRNSHLPRRVVYEEDVYTVEKIGTNSFDEWEIEKFKTIHSPVDNEYFPRDFSKNFFPVVYKSKHVYGDPTVKFVADR